MDEYNEKQNSDGQELENIQPQRPTSLTVLCVLSAINAIYQVFSNITVWSMYNRFQELLDENSEFYEQMGDMMGNAWETLASSYSSIFSINRSYYLISCILYITSFIGVMQMWRLKKRGFHIYTVAQILILIVSTIFIYNTLNGSPIADLIITALFVIFYFKHYRNVMQ